MKDTPMSQKWTGVAIGMTPRPEILYKSITEYHIEAVPVSLLSGGALQANVEIAIGDMLRLSPEDGFYGLGNEGNLFQFRPDGSGQLANGNITWDAYGDVEVNAAKVRGVLEAAGIKVDNLLAGNLTAEVGVFGRLWVGVKDAEGVEINSEGIVGYDSNRNKQFWMSTETGKGVFGAGAGTLDVNGLTLEMNSGKEISFLSGGVEYAYINAYQYGIQYTGDFTNVDATVQRFRAYKGAAYYSGLDLTVDGSETHTSAALLAQHGPGQNANVYVYADAATELVQINGLLDCQDDVTILGTLTIADTISGVLSAASGVVGAVTPEAKADHNNWAALSDVVAALAALGLIDEV